ncbi:hypothetical protein Nepgr_003286 [Nepenthes gracilis]|uniref:Cytochrome P450 n=1 Tax=Nepenthes gracilis TaxID=150966 RepID=A0AAD3RZ95_NEPGR|nr:hypothetical protein Nepgr_003286 [Nepenthes gracilis]
MEAPWLWPSLFLLSLFFVFKWQRRSTKPKLLLPLTPSPPALPVVGHLHLLKHPIHQTLHGLSLKYGPIFSLRFGSLPVVVIESPALVEECFSGKNDAVFASRPFLLMGKHIGYNYNVLIAAPYGEHWRRLRKTCSLEIFSLHRLNLSVDARKEETKRLVRKLYKQSSENCSVKVDMKSFFSELAFNVLVKMVAGNRYCGEDFVEGRDFREIVHEVFKFAGAFYPADFVPLLRLIDYQGYEKRIKKLAMKTDAFFQGLIMDARRTDEREGTIVDHLLSQQESEPEFYSDQTIKGLIMVMLMAGIDTTSETMEWAMSLLLNHPEELSKAKSEIDIYIGRDRLIEESDLLKLSHLDNIIAETLRLYPAVPLLIPHMSSQDCVVAGFHVPRGTMLFANVWAIHRDPNLWENPTDFMPERFQSRDVDASRDFKFLPFGTGRRACPGMGLANRVVGLVLASLIQCFEWERISEEKVDMTEGGGLNMPKSKPLEAICRVRPFMHDLISG